jgi:hypothetical protein
MVKTGAQVMTIFEEYRCLVVTLCNSEKAQHFIETYHLHLHGRREALLATSFLFVLLFNPEDEGDMFL